MLTGNISSLFYTQLIDELAYQRIISNAQILAENVKTATFRESSTAPSH